MRRLAGNLAAALLWACLSLGCVVSSDEFLALQSDVTQLEKRVKGVESGALPNTQRQISTLAQSQRNQTGTVDQALTKLSRIEKDLDTLLQQQRQLASRMDRLEKAQLNDRKSLSGDLDALKKDNQSSMRSSLNQLRGEFNSAQKELSRAVDKRMAGFSETFNAKVKKIDNEISTFYRELESTIQSYSSGTYIVKSGDSLSKIAQELGVSVEDLARVNTIKDPSKIRVGQELLLP